MLIRKVCEAYQGVTPKDLEEQTLNQLLTMALPESNLKNQGRYKTGTLEELIAMGVVKWPPEREEKRHSS